MRAEISFTPPLLQPTWFKCLAKALLIAILLLKQSLVFQFTAVSSFGAVHTAYFHCVGDLLNAKLLFRVIAIGSVLVTVTICEVSAFRHMISLRSRSVQKMTVGDVILIYVLINALYVPFIFSSPLGHIAPELTCLMQMCLIAAYEYTTHILRVHKEQDRDQ